MQTLISDDDFRTLRAEDLEVGDVVNLKGGPAVVYGIGYLPLSGRIVLGLADDAWANYPRTREVVVSSDMVYSVFPGKGRA